MAGTQACLARPIMCSGPCAPAWSEASPSDPQSCPVMGHCKGLWPLGSSATLPLLLPLNPPHTTPPSLPPPPPDAFGLKLGVGGLGTGGHASVTRATDTLNLGVVTYYQAFFASGL